MISFHCNEVSIANFEQQCYSIIKVQLKSWHAYYQNRLEGHVYTIVWNNYCNFPLFYQRLLDWRTFVTNTIAGSRIGFFNALLGYKQDEHKKRTFFWQMHKDRHMTATTRLNLKPIAFFSTSRDLVEKGQTSLEYLVQQCLWSCATTPPRRSNVNKTCRNWML